MSIISQFETKFTLKMIMKILSGCTRYMLNSDQRKMHRNLILSSVTTGRK